MVAKGSVFVMQLSVWTN